MAQMNFRGMMMSEEAESFRLDIFYQGKKQPGSEQVVAKLLGDKHKQVPIVNDDFDASFGAISTRADFKNLYKTTYMRGTDIPQHWCFFRKCPFLIFLIPNFDTFSDRQFRAVLDYVRQGGILIIAHPRAAVAMAGTPLAELLPVTPLRFRKITELPALKTLAPDFKGWGKLQEVDFLETEAFGDGKNLLMQNEFPVFRWKRYGLGSVRFSAFPLSEEVIGPTKVNNKLLKIFFRHQPLYNDVDYALSCLNEMTGFQVPGYGLVRGIFLIYFVILATVMIGGAYFRKTSLAWISASAIALLITVWVLQKAASGSSHQGGRLLAAVESSYPGIDGEAISGFYGIFSSVDTQLDLKGERCDNLLAAIPPNCSISRLGNFGLMGGGARPQPIEVNVNDAVSKISDLNISTNTSRQFAVVSSQSQGRGVAGTPAAELIFDDQGFKLLPWVIPSGLNIASAWLHLPNGIIPLVKKEGKLLYDPKRGGLFQSDEIQTAIQKNLQFNARHTAPHLVLMSKLTDPVLALPENTFCNGRRLTFLPVQEVIPAGLIRIPGEMIVLTSADSTTRLVMAGNEIEFRGGTQTLIDYTFCFHLPPVFADLQVEEITVDFSYMNQGGNVKAKPVLVKDRPAQVAVPEKKKRWKKKNKWHQKNKTPDQGFEISGQETSPGRYVFKDIAGVIDYADGAGRLRLKVQSKNPSLAATEKIRANKWTITKLRINVSGRMPEAIKEFRY